MRKRRVLFGWPRYDPCHYRFAIPNSVWDHRLKPSEFKIFSCLCYYASHGQTTKVTLDAVAESVRLSADAVRKYLSGLMGRGLITAELSLAPDVQHTSTEKFFTLPNEIFLLNLPPSAFVAYAYLLLIEDRRTHTCHPSYNTIAAATGMVKNTVIKSIDVLLEMSLITMEHSRYFDRRGMKWKGNNLYTFLPVREAMDAFLQRQLDQLELGAERRHVRSRQEECRCRRPRTALCATAAAQAAPDPSSLSEPPCSR